MHHRLPPGDAVSYVALRRRFDREVALPAPDLAGRRAVLARCTARLRLGDDVDLGAVAERCAGYVAGDLAALAREAAVQSGHRVFAALGTPAACALPQAALAGFAVSAADFDEAFTRTVPSARREGFSSVPSVTWADVGALADVREDLTACLIEPLRRPERLERLGLRSSQGVLLYGPPGCGKTLVAKAAANESGASFISVKGPELLSKYVGDSEAAVRQVFGRAASCPPCIVFFDEIDSLASARGSDDNAVSGRVVAALLVELDGVVARPQVSVIGASNRGDLLDPALLRPGRLDRHIFIPLPSPPARGEILRIACRRVPVADDVDLDGLAAERCEGFTGADLTALVKEASIAALRSWDKSQAGEDAPGGGDAGVMVTMAHFTHALGKVQRSVTVEAGRGYEAMRARMAGAR